jgi:hypothetical protein
VVVAQLRHQGEEQFVTGTVATFTIWMDDEFQQAVQWVLYELKEQTWREFVQAHRGKYGERAFNRVGAYYNRIGYLVTHRLLGDEDQLLLATAAGSAIAVWQKIEPLVLEARLIDNSTMFEDFELMLPECYECYVPSQPAPHRGWRKPSRSAHHGPNRGR